MAYVDGLAEGNTDVQREILQRSLPFWKNDRIGLSDAEAWENMQEVLLDMELMTQPVDLNEAFTNKYLP
jgi:NitT/TauT family transport system substrate-binding protein